ncbi:MAG: aspartate--tRNA ligase [Flexibacteraceae bacterium]
MLRSHTCGELRLSDINKPVQLCGWVQGIRDKGGLIWIDLRDRYGITQLILDESRSAAEVVAKARTLGREFVISASGIVIERSSKNPNIGTGEIEIDIQDIQVLNSSKVPPFLIQDETDGGDDLRMKYRYLDLRRASVRSKLELRHKVAQQTRRYMDEAGFIEVETPVLIKSTPEGARDFVVPSRMNAGEFYALPQSPQTFKQLLMVSGFDKYFQIVKCFRDEDLRADRQPEFTQIDCEMSFVEQADIISVFTGLTKTLFKNIIGVELPETFRTMEYADAMRLYGSDKPDLRFGMEFHELNDLVKGKNFPVFDDAEMIIGINATGAAGYTRKQLDELTEWVKRPQIGAKGLAYIRYNADGTLKSSVDKFYTEADLKAIAEAFNAQPNDLILILSGEENKVRKQMNELRLEMGERLGLRSKDKFEVLWVVNFPLLEYGEEEQRWFAMHHPFTSPKPEDMALIDTNPGAVRANAYDLVINGVEIGGGSIRIFDRTLQSRMFDLLGFTPEEAKAQFGFLMEAFEYGAPPHGGIAFGFDRLCAMLGGSDSIRDYIAFPKNNSGRDMMIDSPSAINPKQLDELHIGLKVK